MSSAPTFLARRVAATRERPDGAAVLVEFALALPVLAIFLLGMFEFGYGFRQKLFVERATQSAGRVAASAGNDRYADFDALRAIDSSLGGASNIEVERVIIWKAPNATAGVPQNCLDVGYTGLGTKGVGGLCNVYSPAQVATSSPVGFPGGSATNPTCAGGSWDANWCPRGRDRTPPGVDFVGVYVEVKYTMLTSILPVDELTFVSETVYHLEPTYVGR
jgi:hypothetical protein